MKNADYIKTTDPRNGQAFLSMIFLIGGIMLIIAVVMAIIAATFIDSGYGVQASNTAEAGAMGGAEDAYMQLVRNTAFANTSGYTVNAGSASATVTVTQGSPSTGYATALSVATVNGRTKKVQAVFSINAAGQVSVVSWGDAL